MRLAILLNKSPPLTFFIEKDNKNVIILNIGPIPPTLKLRTGRRLMVGFY